MRTTQRLPLRRVTGGERPADDEGKLRQLVSGSRHGGGSGEERARTPKGGGDGGCARRLDRRRARCKVRLDGQENGVALHTRRKPGKAVPGGGEAHTRRTASPAPCGEGSRTRQINQRFRRLMVADAVLRNRSRTGASRGASCRGAPARGHTGLQLYIFSVELAVASRATTRRQIVSLTNDLLGQGHRRVRVAGSWVWQLVEVDRVGARAVGDPKPKKRPRGRPFVKGQIALKHSSLQCVSRCRATRA